MNQMHTGAPALLRPALREVRNRIFDSARWQPYRARRDDIIVATYQKCGTTWTQRILTMLVFASAAPRNIREVSPWFDIRVQPLEETHALAEAQTHRRILKSHLAYDALPVYEGVKFIHVARDGRDAAMSWHNHASSYTPDFLAALDAVSLSDPKFGDHHPRIDPDPARHFHDWVLGPGDDHGDPGASFFHLENSYWAARHDANMLLVHYADMKRDLANEMRRIADFLCIDIAPSLWPELVDAARFENMKRQGDEIFPADHGFMGGSQSFFHKGTNGRWKDVVSAADLALYDAKVKQHFSPELARWIEHGNSGAQA